VTPPPLDDEDDALLLTADEALLLADAVALLTVDDAVLLTVDDALLLSAVDAALLVPAPLVPPAPTLAPDCAVALVSPTCPPPADPKTGAPPAPVVAPLDMEEATPAVLSVQAPRATTTTPPTVSRKGRRLMPRGYTSAHGCNRLPR
jgi:hypothetical protein